MVAVGIVRDGLNSEAWINKMTVMTTNMWEKAYKEAQKNIEVENPDVRNLNEDIKLKHYGT